MTDTALNGRRIGVIGLGDLGAALASRLVVAGARVTGVRRGTEAPTGVELLRADLADASALACLRDDLEALVVSVTPDRYDLDGYRATYLEGARSLATALAGRGLTRVFWVSSTGVYGEQGGGDVDDATPAEPDSERGRVLLAAEQALVESDWPVTAVRLAGIYGPGRNALIDRVRSGRGAPEEPVQWTNRIHRDDAVEVIVFLLARALAGDRVPEVVIGSDGAPTPRHEVMAWLAEQLGVTLTVSAEEEGSRAPSRRLWPRALKELGFTWRYPDYRVGYRAQLDAAERGRL
ncbi:MAG: NAD-dependent epimerase/dehydratase family protein [Gammaproteobacteria bacterium]|nr:MAG: NAD-dependent epimerase/dehydratase family protein [Gammaproteobacteria bacterium]